MDDRTKEEQERWRELAALLGLPPDEGPPRTAKAPEPPAPRRPEPAEELLPAVARAENTGEEGVRIAPIRFGAPAIEERLRRGKILPLAGATAYRALFTRGGLRADETVVVLGAGSGVSTIAVALARMAGARVLVTSSSPEKLAHAAELGAVGFRTAGFCAFCFVVRAYTPVGIKSAPSSSSARRFTQPLAAA